MDENKLHIEESASKNSTIFILKLTFWLGFSLVYAFTFFLQMFWIGLADERVHLYFGFGLAIFVTGTAFWLFPKAKGFWWLLLAPFIFPIGIACIMLIVSLFEAPLYLGNQQLPVTGMGYASLVATLILYLFQGYWLVKTCPFYGLSREKGT